MPRLYILVRINTDVPDIPVCRISATAAPPQTYSFPVTFSRGSYITSTTTHPSTNLTYRIFAEVSNPRGAFDPYLIQASFDAATAKEDFGCKTDGRIMKNRAKPVGKFLGVVGEFEVAAVEAREEFYEWDLWVCLDVGGEGEVVVRKEFEGWEDVFGEEEGEEDDDHEQMEVDEEIIRRLERQRID